MKKYIFIIIALCFLSAPLANAAPAPKLSKVIIYALASEETSWLMVNNYSYPRKIAGTLYGENLYLCVKFTGYPSGNVIICQKDRLIPHNNIDNYKQENIAGGIARYYKIPYAALTHNGDSLGSFSVQGFGSPSGSSTGYVDNVNFVYR